ncbi:hypothetical protein CesoFtcFv8_026234 [Champsocephalus esox]|uniref:Secreted protein n=3 Tax=Channichthyidae TaxID=30806 RepID=A0AAN8H1Q3_CHAGU|nr:hypothetical protein KUCAC02_006570 [Chaenocephalus aceratus]KAK5876932.1 hypothetical protein CesoFtcFv8_026234 [Champsocephalus esox]KAK5896124.1 hypothetical protein CgunFtcFv8_009758 [Champsocephalus gunnari]
MCCFGLIVMACAVSLCTRSVLDFWPQEEPSRAYIQGTEWPRYGGCVVAKGRMHVADGERQDSRSGTYRTAFTGHKGPA